MVLLSSKASLPQSVGRSRNPTVRRPRKKTTTSYREAWQKLFEVRKPMFYLDERFRYPSSSSVPTLHYGIGYTVEGIMYCAQKHQLLRPPPDDKPLTKEQNGRRFARAVFKVLDYLETELNTPLFMSSAIAPGYAGIFSLYSNHTRQLYHQPSEEREVLNFMRQELKCRKQQAAWYWDASLHGVDYSCELDEFNL